jgi:maleamate amidohydrolase
MQLKKPLGLLIIDFVNGFANPEVFGGGNINDAIKNTVPLLAHARAQGWAIAHSRIVFSDDDSDRNVFTMKVPGGAAILSSTTTERLLQPILPITFLPSPASMDFMYSPV